MADTSLLWALRPTHSPLRRLFQVSPTRRARHARLATGPQTEALAMTLRQLLTLVALLAFGWLLIVGIIWWVVR
jgi:hypothetical protein